MVDGSLAARPTSLVDLLDRVLSGGVVVAGEVTVCVADVELVHVSLRLLLSSVSALAAGSPGAVSRPEVMAAELEVAELEAAELEAAEVEAP
jgi:hypothetical protein